MNSNFYSLNISHPKHNNQKFGNRAFRVLLMTFVILFAARTISFGQPVSYLFKTPGTVAWTCPAGITSVTVELWGGGGAGGGASSGNKAGGGGGGGAHVLDTFTVVPSTAYSVTVGAGGTGVAGGNGNPGTASWFDNASTFMAVGGDGGQSGAAGVSGGIGEGGPGGAAGSCIPYANASSGGDGSEAGTDNFGFVVSGAGGTGGAVGGSGSTGAAAGIIGSAGGNGNPGIPIGGGGSGGLVGTSATTPKGGDGAPGRVIITYNYIAPNGIYNLENAEHYATAFPNPTDGKATVQFNSETAYDYTFSVLDITGRLLVNNEGKTETGVNGIRLDLSAYGKGIYLVRLQSGDKNQLVKLVVK